MTPEKMKLIETWAFGDDAMVGGGIPFPIFFDLYDAYIHECAGGLVGRIVAAGGDPSDKLGELQAKLTHPSVHLNGTSGGELLRQVTEVMEGIRSAMTALRMASPNQRDYYPQGEAAWTRAKAEHESRQARLEALYNELAALYMTLQDTIAVRRRGGPG